MPRVFWRLSIVVLFCACGSLAALCWTLLRQTVSVGPLCSRSHCRCREPRISVWIPSCVPSLSDRLLCRGCSWRCISRFVACPSLRWCLSGSLSPTPLSRHLRGLSLFLAELMDWIFIFFILRICIPFLTLAVLAPILSLLCRTRRRLFCPPPLRLSLARSVIITA